jgi:hypothetical protein
MLFLSVRPDKRRPQSFELFPVEVHGHLAAAGVGQCEDRAGLGLHDLPTRLGGEPDLLGQPVGSLEVRDLDQDPEGMARMDEDLVPDAARVLVVTEEGDAPLLKVGHGLAEIRCLQGDVVDAPFSVLEKAIEKTPLPGGRDDLQAGQIAQGKNLPEEPGLGITHPNTGNSAQDVTEKMLGLCLVSDRDRYVIDS